MPTDRFRLVSFILSSFLMIQPLLALVSADIPDYNEIRNILKSDVGIPYEILREYFDSETGIKNEKIVGPRLFPLCVQTKTLEGYSPLNRFASIWNEMDKQDECGTRPLRFYEYNASLHSMKYNKEWIESVTFTRINTPEVDVRNMRQWMHITIKAKKPLLALYLQPVVGAIGLPSGEFSLEFPCSDLAGGDTSAQDSLVFHCDYRSRAGLNHPMAFFGGYQGKNQMTEFHVHYKWTDISCLETPFLQFIIIAIQDFKIGSTVGPKVGQDFQPLLSPVYSNIDFDSIDGAITPYYIGWKNEMTCFKTSADPNWAKSQKLYHDTDFENLKWKESHLERILANEELDECATAKTSNERDEDHKECSPGPFECPKELSLKTVSDQGSFQDIVKRRQTEFEQAASVIDCTPCVLPKEKELYEGKCASAVKSQARYLSPILDYNPEWHDAFQRDASTQDSVNRRPLDPYFYLDYSEYLNSAVDARYHGVLAIFVNVVMSPFAVLMARFYRGIPVQRVDRNDFWIMLHSSFHLFGLFLYWASIGFVPTGNEGLITTGQNCYREAEVWTRDNKRVYNSSWTQEDYEEWLYSCTYSSRNSTHSGLGTFSFLIHNLNVFLSFFRSRTDFIRNIQVAIHSHLGYFDMLFSLITVYFALNGQQCSELLGYLIFLAIFSLLTFGVTTSVTKSEDKEIGVDPPRYRWPILEPIRTSSPGPFYETKMAILGVYAGVLIFTWVLTVVAVSRVSISETTLLANTDTDNSIYGIFKRCRLPDFFAPP